MSLLITNNAEVNSGIGSNCQDKKVKKSLSKNLNRTIDYLTPNAKQIFIQLKELFIKALIPYHLNLEYYIQIETDMSGYIIGVVQGR